MEPERYDKKVTLIDKQGNKIEEKDTPYTLYCKVGILWIFDKKRGTFIGGDKTPGSSVAAPLNSYFIELIRESKDNINMFKNAVGEESSGFVVALEVIFKERDKQTVKWAEGYNYQIFFPKGQRENFKKTSLVFIDWTMLKKIRVKSVVPL